MGTYMYLIDLCLLLLTVLYTCNMINLIPLWTIHIVLHLPGQQKLIILTSKQYIHVETSLRGGQQGQGPRNWCKAFLYLYVLVIVWMRVQLKIYTQVIFENSLKIAWAFNSLSPASKTVKFDPIVCLFFFTIIWKAISLLKG